MAQTYKSIITKTEFIRKWESGKVKVFFHNVWFEKQEGKEPFEIGAREKNPDFLKVGSFLDYEFSNKEERKIKRVNIEGPKKKAAEVKAEAKRSSTSDGALIRAVEKFDEKNLIFIDVETARVEKELTEGTPLYEAWLYKARYNNEVDKKTGKPQTPEEYYVDKAALYPPFARIVSVVIGRIDGDKLKTKSYSHDSEAELLADLNTDINKFLEKNPSTVFCGWANNSFDQPFVAKRMVVHGIKPAILFDTAHLKPWEVASLDLKLVWMATGFYPDSLIAVAYALGLPSPKSKLDGSLVGEAFYDGKIDEIVEYNVRDVVTTANIWRKFKNNGGPVTL